MAFSGEYQNNMDAKGRVILPIKFREAIGSKFVLTKGFDGNLLIYPMDEWAKTEEKLAGLKMSNKSSRIVKRLILGSAVEIEIDGQDRMSIPQNLRTYGDLKKELLFVGQATYIEVWSVDKFAEASDVDVTAAAEEVDF